MELTRQGRKRVVITGLGVVSPLGAKADFWTAIQAGESGIRKLQNIETAHLDVRIGGEVRGFDSSAYIPRKQARRMGRATQFAIVAAMQAVEDAGLTIEALREIGERVATVIGTTLGSYEIGEAGIHSWRESGSQARQSHEYRQCSAQYAGALRQQNVGGGRSLDHAVSGLRDRHPSTGRSGRPDSVGQMRPGGRGRA